MHIFSVKTSIDLFAGSGMGEAVAKHLAGKGWQVAILDMNEKSGQAVAQEIGGIFAKTDVTSYDSQSAAFGKVWEKYSQIDFGKLHPTLQ
jgi:NADP-dependent 3-hydroxy acid dehydrogenase YdfG